VAQVQVAIRFGREPGADLRMLSGGQVVPDDLADEVLLQDGRFGRHREGLEGGTRQKAKFTPGSLPSALPAG